MEQYKTMLIHYFQTDMVFNKTIYIKNDNNKIIIHRWKDGFAYEAPYRCLPSNLKDMSTICTYVENKLHGMNKRGEFNLFIKKLNTGYSVDGISIRELSLSDEKQLEQMKQQCSMSDVEQAQITIHDMHVLGAFVNGKLVGLCSILNLWETYDIGVLVHPEYRRKGIATYLVAENTRWSITQHKISMYRCDKDNIGSYHTALKLGYQKEIDVIIYDLKEGK